MGRSEASHSSKEAFLCLKHSPVKNNTETRCTVQGASSVIYRKKNACHWGLSYLLYLGLIIYTLWQHLKMLPTFSSLTFSTYLVDISFPYLLALCVAYLCILSPCFFLIFVFHPRRIYPCLLHVLSVLTSLRQLFYLF